MEKIKTMKMKKSLVLGGAAVMALAFAACHKSSTSSSSGSVNGAMGNLTGAAFQQIANSYSGTFGASVAHPHATSQICTTGSITLPSQSFSTNFNNNNGQSCGISGESSMTQTADLEGGNVVDFSTCVINGYTYNGGISINTSSGVMSCTSSSGGRVVSGSAGLASSTNFTVTGPNFSCNSINVNVNLSYSANTYSGNITGAACGSTGLNIKF